MEPASRSAATLRYAGVLWTALALGIAGIVAAAVTWNASGIAPIWFIVSAVLLAALSALSAIDFQTYRLPDKLTLPLAAAGLALPILLQQGESLWTDVSWRAISAVGAFATFWGIAFAYERMRGRPGLGLGDAKLFAAAGSWLGAENLPHVLFFASVAAITVTIVRQRGGDGIDGSTRIAFGPFLATGFWLVWILIR